MGVTGARVRVGERVGLLVLVGLGVGGKTGLRVGLGEGGKVGDRVTGCFVGALDLIGLRVVGAMVGKKVSAMVGLKVGKGAMGRLGTKVGNLWGEDDEW